MIKVNITSNEPYQHSVSHSMILRTQHTSVVYISRIPNLNFIIAKHQSYSNWETFYKITTYQNVTKKCQHNGTQEQIEKLSRWKKSLAQQLYPVWNPVLDHETEKKDISGETGNTQIWALSVEKGAISMLIS